MKTGHRQVLGPDPRHGWSPPAAVRVHSAVMSDKRRILGLLSKAELLELSYVFELPVVQRMSVDELRDVVAGSKRATLPRLLPHLRRDRLKEACEELGLAVSGSKNALVARLLGEGHLSKVDAAQTALLLDPAESEEDLPASEHPVKTPPPPVVRVEKHLTAGTETKKTDELVKQPSPTAQLETELETEPMGEPCLSRRVPPRRPRLVWHGFDHHEVTTAVPTQVVEIVRPSRFIGRSGELDLDVSRASSPLEGSDASLPPNRLIWTNDNLVALQTLLDEKDPETRGYRYRGKIDLIYIDPPFMVQSDFRAENAIDIDLDENEGVQVKKEPSLVEILAYKDTWREGLDSFLSMLRERLVLLKELLAPTGSIYVHLDWHAVHYVKVLMDEFFGYENFHSEIVWKRASARSGTHGGNHIHDTLLAYSAGSRPYYYPQRLPHEADYVRSHYRSIDERGRYRLIPLNAPGIRSGETGQPWRGYHPPKGRHWSHMHSQLDEFAKLGLVQFPTKGKNPELKQYLHEYEGIEVQSLWIDVAPVNPQAAERLGYPTQKPVELIERIISTAAPKDGLVLDCFLGSGTTAEAAERLGRRWIGIDNAKYAIHLARKRLIQLHGQSQPPEKAVHDYIECEHCKNIERKEKPQRSPGKFEVRPFTLENMGVYQRAESWQGFQTEQSEYRKEMVRVFGGIPSSVSPRLHGEKGQSWIHVGPLDSAIVVSQVWAIAREAAITDRKSVTILAAEYNTLSDDDTAAILAELGVRVRVRIIPASAIDEIKRRIEARRDKPDVPYTSTTIPAFYAPLAILLHPEVRGRTARLTLVRCEVDIESFLESQQPSLKPITDGMNEIIRKKAQAEIARWAKRRSELENWLAKADSWQRFVDFWAVDWEYGRRQGADNKPIFETDWQSFRVRRSKKEVEPLSFAAEREYQSGGRYRVAARVTDVFGNDGIATVDIDVR